MRGYGCCRPFVSRCLTIRTILRFHIPLIKPDGPVSSIRLSDRFHELDRRGLASAIARKKSDAHLPDTTLPEIGDGAVGEEGTTLKELRELLCPASTEKTEKVLQQAGIETG